MPKIAYTSDASLAITRNFLLADGVINDLIINKGSINIDNLGLHAIT